MIEQLDQSIGTVLTKLMNMVWTTIPSFALPLIMGAYPPGMPMPHQPTTTGWQRTPVGRAFVNLYIKAPGVTNRSGVPISS